MSSIMKLDNYQVLFGLKVFKSVLTTFVDSFLVLYFLNLSNSNILPLGIYKIVSMAVVFITIFSLRNMCKSKNRVLLLRIGIFLDLIYFLSIIVLKDNIVDYMYIVGILYGLEEGFYYSVFNMFESDGVSNCDRARFSGDYTLVKSILSIVFPIFFGSLIISTGFLNSVLVVLSIVVVRIALSFMFKDRNLPHSSKSNIKKYVNIIKEDKNIKAIYIVEFFNALTYSQGALSNIVTIYIIKVFSDSFSLGIVTSLFSLISCGIGFLFARYIKSKNYSNIIGISMTSTIISLIIMVVNCNPITIVLFKLLQTISKGLTDLINENSKANISNLTSIRKEYKVEYYLGIEFMLFLGRIISQGLFIAMAFVDIMYILPIFVIFLVLFMINSIKLQISITK